MTQQVKEPAEQEERMVMPPRGPHPHLTRAGVISLLVLIALLALLFAGQFAFSLPQAIQQHSLATPSAIDRRVVSSPSPQGRSSLTPVLTPDPRATEISPFTVPAHPDAPSLSLPAGRYVIYEQDSTLYLVSSTGDIAQIIPTQGFVSNNATPPIITPSGQIIYAGAGIWMTDIFNGTPVQLAALAPDQVITSMALSSDGKMIAWSTEPVDGIGSISIYAGPLNNPALVYQQSTLNCPCYRIFSFLNGAPAQADTTLLLADDRGSQEAVQYGLWALDLRAKPALLQSMLDENPQQGPLALTPFSNTLLYSTDEGAVPQPTDSSIPEDVAALSYANSLSITTISGSPLALGASQTILPEQDNLSNSAQYHWVTTPVFSPDAHTLAYVEFSSDDQEPYDRHSAIYTVQISGSGVHLKVGKPHLLATTTSRLVELGPWMNSHVLTFYADGTIYAIDIQSGAFTSFARTVSYAHIVAVVGFSGG